MEALRLVARVMVQPVETYNELKLRRYRNWAFVWIMMAAFFLSAVVMRQFYGFRFNYNDIGKLNVFVQLCMTVIPFWLFCIANWAVCTIGNGEGKINEICTFAALALTPYILCSLTATALSNILVLEEESFLQVLLVIGGLWSGMLLFQAIRIVHNYSGLMTMGIILLTVLGIEIILFILLLLYALFQQMYSFVSTIYSELMYRK